jgi:hypothetical protein
MIDNVENDNAIDGNIVYLNEPHPDTGSHLSFDANKSCKSVAIMKFGTEIPIIARNIEK